MLRGARWAAPLLATVVALALAVPAAAGAAAKPSLTVSDPCTYLTTAQVQKIFRGPTTTARPGAAIDNAVCNFVVGPNGSVGTLVSALVFPFFQGPGQTAVSTVESERATDAVAGLTIESIGVGKTGYANLDLSIVTVAANKKFAFKLQWIPQGTPPDGSMLTPMVRKQLLGAARAIVARGPK